MSDETNEKSSAPPTPPRIRDAAKHMAQALMELDLATATDDPYLRDEIRFIKNRVVNIYAWIEGSGGE